MAYRAGEFAVAASATSLATALGITDLARQHVKKVILRNNPAAANDAYVGMSNVTTGANRGAVLRATDTYPHVIGSDAAPALVDLTKVFVIGTVNAANIIFASWIE